MMHPRTLGYAALAVGCLAVACSSAPSHTARDASAPAPAPASAPVRASKRPAATIESAAFAQDADGARIVVNADGPLLYTSYEPRPDTLVVDIAGAHPAGTFSTPPVEGSLVTGLKVEPVDELGHHQTRLTIQHPAGSKFEIASQGKSLAIGFEPEKTAETAPAASTEVASVTEPPAPAISPAPEPRPAPGAAVVTAVDLPASVAANVPRGEAARALERVDVSGTGANAIVSLLGDGALVVHDFALENPPRIVLDVTGVRAQVPRRVVPGAGPVLRARISQFKTSPDRVARVVIDLDRSRPYRTDRDGERVLVHLGETVASTAPAPAAPVAVATRVEPMPAPSVAAIPAPAAPPETTISRTEIAKPAAGEPATLVADASAGQHTNTVPASHSDASPGQHSDALTASPTAPEPVAKAVPAAAAPEMPKQDPKPVSSPKPADAPEAPASSLARYATGPAVDSIPASKRAHGVLEARKSPRPKADPAAAAPVPASVPRAAAQDPLFESAEVMLNNQERPLDKQELANTYKSKTVGGGETQYTGEPISLDLKDADIKDVFRTISELTGLNIVIDPDVHGQATVKLDNVPWDQALELILKQNNLGYIIENNVMRIATTGKLQSEEQQRAALDLARQGSLPTRTVIKRLSYATAGTAAGTLKRVMSPRGDVIVDDRTNTLIIREIQDYMPTVLQLLENLDRPTDQVIIESRIVETTKTFGHTLGVNWGFNGIADAAHGNTTNLVFPNNGAVGGTVFTRPVGNAQPSSTGLALRLGNVLDTFSLDIALNAAENQGLVKIVSSPRVAAMTNQRASIQTGLQIPVQTTVNNTTSVIYVDATLQLQVTPQITAEGTILMDVNIQKREPAPGVQIQGGGNVPLSIRQAQTKIIVKDGGTAVIGGIFQMNDNDSYNYVPGLGKIPIIGNLFRTKQKLENHDELLIFITPRIIH
jgi:type IV pilus assembly protein PilQ